MLLNIFLRHLNISAFCCLYSLQSDKENSTNHCTWNVPTVVTLPSQEKMSLNSHWGIFLPKECLTWARQLPCLGAGMLPSTHLFPAGSVLCYPQERLNHAPWGLSSSSRSFRASQQGSDWPPHRTANWETKITKQTGSAGGPGTKPLNRGMEGRLGGVSLCALCPTAPHNVKPRYNMNWQNSYRNCR